MYILVKLLKGYQKPLYYKIPQNLNLEHLQGKIVNVPIKNYNVPALVLKTYEKKPPKLNFKIREINNLQRFPDDPKFHEFVKKISKFYLVKPLYFYQRIKNFLEQNNKAIKTKLKSHSNSIESKEIILTKEQDNVFQNIKKNILTKNNAPALLHGVTGSGKTEIYKKILIETIKKNKSVILLLPEVSLAVQFEHLLKKQLAESIKIIGFHSASKISDKRELWKNLLENKSMLIIGVHLPILLPIPNLGLIIVDEEHEAGFQEKKYPKINSKELALWRAQFYDIPIILGSATPSSSSLYNLKKKNWHFYQLKKRFSGEFPTIELVFLKEEKNRYKKQFWISKQLKKEIEDRLEKKEQCLIYINRRGYSFFVQCKNCGFIFECPNCSVSLTMHKNVTGGEELLCHYCDYKKTIPNICPGCKQKEESFLRKGIGTQQAVKILQEVFPNSKIARADLDTTNKKGWTKTLQDFEDGNIDILVGTQVITKGYHFPKVTLVGILWADLNLHFPIFNAAETTLQKLIQVAGRAGRQTQNSKVIVQAIQNHEIFSYLNEENYPKFIEEELEFRKLAGFPPYKRLIQIELKNTDVPTLEKDAKKLTDLLQKNNNSDLVILGPAKPAVYKIQKTECRNIFVKTSNFKHFYEILKKIDLNSFNSSVFITPTQ